MKLYKIALLAIVLSGCHLAKEVTRKNNLAIESNSCNVIDNPEYPYIIDWDGSEINNLMSSSNKGAVIVSYDNCRNIKILDECKISGDYIKTASASPFLDVKILGTKLEISATLPFNISNILGRISDTSTLEMKVLTLGDAEFIKSNDAFELEGGDSCFGATHYISRMDLGASSLIERSSLKREAEASISILETSTIVSNDNNFVIKRSDITACKNLGFENKNCRVPLRIRLSKITNIISEIRLEKRYVAQKQARLNSVIEEHLREVESRYLQMIPYLRRGDEEAKIILDRFEAQYADHPLGNHKLEEAKSIYEESRNALLLEKQRQQASSINQVKEHNRVYSRSFFGIKYLSRIPDHPRRQEAIDAINSNADLLFICLKSESIRNSSLLNSLTFLSLIRFNIKISQEGFLHIFNIHGNNLSIQVKRCIHNALGNLRISEGNFDDVFNVNIPREFLLDNLRSQHSSSSSKVIQHHQREETRLTLSERRAQIKDIFSANYERWQHCNRYNTSDVSVTLTFKIDVLQNGRIHSITQINNISEENTHLARCVKTMMMTLKFPEHSHDNMMTITYPFRFTR